MVAVPAPVERSPARHHLGLHSWLRFVIVLIVLVHSRRTPPIGVVDPLGGNREHFVIAHIAVMDDAVLHVPEFVTINDDVDPMSLVVLDLNWSAPALLEGLSHFAGEFRSHTTIIPLQTDGEQQNSDKMTSLETSNPTSPPAKSAQPPDLLPQNAPAMTARPSLLREGLPWQAPRRRRPEWW